MRPASGEGEVRLATTIGNTRLAVRLRPALQWPLIFVLPYLAAFLLLVVYPVGYGFWLGHAPSTYKLLWADDTYRQAIINTLLYVGIGVNVKLVLALLLSGFFAVSRWWIKALLPVFLLPWAIPAVPGMLSIHYMLDSQFGMLNTLLSDIGIAHPPDWLVSYKWAMTAAIGAYVWKWLPFWTLILLAARMAISQDIYEAGDVDGAVGIRRFLFITFPLMRNVYLTSTLLSTIWSLSDFNTIRFITAGGPADGTHVFATLGIQYAFEIGNIDEGVGVALTALPVLIPLIVLLVRWLRKEQY